MVALVISKSFNFRLDIGDAMSPSLHLQLQSRGYRWPRRGTGKPAPGPIATGSHFRRRVDAELASAAPAKAP
jgi:hypothetical protein